MAEVVRDDAAGGGIVGELDERFVIRIGQNREPAGGELPFLSTVADFPRGS